MIKSLLLLLLSSLFCCSLHFTGFPLLLLIFFLPSQCCRFFLPTMNFCPVWVCLSSIYSLCHRTYFQMIHWMISAKQLHLPAALFCFQSRKSIFATSKKFQSFLFLKGTSETVHRKCYSPADHVALLMFLLLSSPQSNTLVAEEFGLDLSHNFFSCRREWKCRLPAPFCHNPSPFPSFLTSPFPFMSSAPPTRPPQALPRVEQTCFVWGLFSVLKS